MHALLIFFFFVVVCFVDQFVVRRETSKSDGTEHRIAGIDWAFNSWGGEHEKF